MTSTSDFGNSWVLSSASRIYERGTAQCWLPKRSPFARDPTSKTARRREEAAVMRAVSDELGNTSAVVRRSYVDPRVVDAYEQGLTIAPALQATVRMIRRVSRH